MISVGLIGSATDMLASEQGWRPLDYETRDSVAARSDTRVGFELGRLDHRVRTRRLRTCDLDPARDVRTERPRALYGGCP